LQPCYPRGEDERKGAETTIVIHLIGRERGVLYNTNSCSEVRKMFRARRLSTDNDDFRKAVFDAEHNISEKH
jgi:hypothetical protein